MEDSKIEMEIPYDCIGIKITKEEKVQITFYKDGESLHTIKRDFIPYTETQIKVDEGILKISIAMG